MGIIHEEKEYNLRILESMLQKKIPYHINVKGIRSFLGHARLYRRFIKDFSKISKPLKNLLQKGVKFNFNEDCILAFKYIKNALLEALIIKPPIWDEPFELICSANEFDVGAILG